MWEGGGRDNSGSTTGAGDTNGDDAVTEQTQKENNAATESGVRSTNGEDAVTEQTQKENSMATESGRRSDGSAGGAEERGSGIIRASGVQDVEAAEGSQRGRQRQGASSEQRGVWVDPATQLVGRIAESDPGAYAFGRW